MIFIAFPLGMTRITHNLKLLVIAVILSLSCTYIIKHPELFVSSVLNLQEIQEIETKQRDIAYKTDKQTLDIFLPLTWNKQWQVTISIAYDPTDVSMNLTKSSSQSPYIIKDQQSGSFILSFSGVSSIDPHQSLFYVPFSGAAQHVLIEDANTTIDGIQHWLSIGKLSPTVIHGN